MATVKTKLQIEIQGVTINRTGRHTGPVPDAYVTGSQAVSRIADLTASSQRNRLGSNF